MESHTKQFRKRNAILECLKNTHSHPSAEMVHQMLQSTHPDISLATVYRNLNYFKQQGLVSSVATVKGVERFDANTQDHVHFICENCDAVLDLHQIHIPEALDAEVKEASGCQVNSCQVTFTGLCSNCQH